MVTLKLKYKNLLSRVKIRLELTKGTGKSIVSKYET